MSIGLEISIEKRHETDEVSEYAFFVRPGRGGLALPGATGRVGIALIKKSTGEVILVDKCLDDTDSGLLFSRVTSVLTRHWKSGSYPDVTWWAG